MAYKNIKEVLVDATKYPAAIEAKLPEGAPKVSTTLNDIAGKIPAIPDFPMEIPDLPAVPELPELPEGPVGLRGRRQYVTGVKVEPVVERRPAAAPPVMAGERKRGTL
ncbi:unnamed protein product [marine sediment metagenome]|uniref:Uncharacterized protein n=1 Tax=marine sediment metagenome TaxID=412755 RepID=X1REM6_9ZZZZ